VQREQRTRTWTYTLCSLGSSIAHHPVTHPLEYQLFNFFAYTVPVFYRHGQLLFIDTINARNVATELTEVPYTCTEHLLFHPIFLDCYSFALAALYPQAYIAKEENSPERHFEGFASETVGCMPATDL
jgi:hypothetical protein